MRYVRFSGGNGYCGCDWEEFCAVDDDTSSKELNEMAAELARDYAESYEYLAEGCDSYTGWENEDDEAVYYEGVTYDWVEITKEEYREGLAN